MTGLMIRWPVAFLVLLGSPAPTLGQAFTAALTGTIVDSDGGVLPGATLVVTNLDTGLERSVTSDQEGRYSVPLLPPGSYRAAAELQGFRRAVREPIVLNLNQQQRADFTLEVGAISEEVVVTAELPMVQTATATVGTVVNQKETSELPLNGRNFLQLNLLVPRGRCPRPRARRWRRKEARSMCTACASRRTSSGSTASTTPHRQSGS